jgi:hypothetical protein
MGVLGPQTIVLAGQPAALGPRTPRLVGQLRKPSVFLPAERGQLHILVAQSPQHAEQVARFFGTQGRVLKNSKTHELFSIR